MSDETHDEKFDAFLNEARDYISEQVTGALSGLFAKAEEKPERKNGGPKAPEPTNNNNEPPKENSGNNSGGNGGGASRRWFGNRA